MRRNKTLYPLVLAVVCAGATALFTSAARAGAPINLLTFDETRVGTVTNPNGSINFNFVTGGGYATVRGALLNTSNFGAGGIVSRPVNLLPTVPTLTQAALIGADVVVIPFQVTLLASEEAALNLFLNQGGGILAFHNNAAVQLASLVGATAGGFTSFGSASVSNATSPITNGPFGSFSVGTTISAGFAGSFAFGGLGANGTDALQHDVGFLAASFTIGSGRAAIFADEAIFLNQPTVAGIAVARLTPTTEDFFLNAFTYVTPSERFAAALDHFLCYEVEGDDVNVTVDLEDQFGLEEQVLVEEPELFCNPVDKNGEGIGDETAHLTGYEIEDEEEVERIVVIANQFGEQTLEVEQPELLFVPSEKDGENSELNLDHFKCYEAEGDAVNVTVTLDDQFGIELEVLVEEPELFCNPVDKNGEGIKDPEAHLTCYEIAERDVLVENQFGDQTLKVDESKLLCVPSEKVEVFEVEDDDDDDDEDDDEDDDDDDDDD